MRVPFGRYKGQRFEDVPDDYLDWLYSLEDLYPDTRKAVGAEWERRRPTSPPPRPPPGARFTCPEQWCAHACETIETAQASQTTTQARGAPLTSEREAIAAIVQEGYRTLTRKWHPDVGGDDATMKRINAAVLWLRARLPKK